jgi:hypothetical protein
MFRLFKSKDLAAKETRVTEIGKMLFGQISIVRDKANAGRIDKSIFEQRINSMFAGGYLIGYADEHLSEMFSDEKSMSKYAERIFEGILPGLGVKLVQSKLAARRVGETISTDSSNYAEVFIRCQEFDTGISAARYEVSEYLSNGEYNPIKLEQYLSTGECPE